MKKWLMVFLLANYANCCLADDVKPAKPALAKEIPTQEKAFVDAINKYSKTQIMQQFGEPAKADDIKLKDSGKIVASIWQYHNINVGEDGKLYETTELDFIDEKVVQVVFLNNDGSEKELGKTYELPKEIPEAPLPEIAPVDIPTDL
jgi:hypothetical protein